MDTSALTEQVIRARLNRIVRGPLLRKNSFVPGNVIQEAARWLLSLHLTQAERLIAEKLTKSILEEYIRRLRWVGKELDESVFKRYGG